ncbi:MAG: 4Fe-4S binding protein [Kiritimatiellia bacterium]
MRLIKSRILRVGGWIVAALAPLCALASSRFPQPQFDSGYVAEKVAYPMPSFVVTPMMDVLLLVAALCVAVFLVRQVRSRRWILFFGMVCLGWFGFVRQGCFCPIGTIQNVALALFSGVRLPLAIALFFAAPLIFALFYGRVFCSVVCPLGALQEFFIVKPLHVPRALDAVLRVIPLIVLTVGVVCAINGAGFIICRTDPFVGLFRQSAALPMLLTGMGVLLVGTVVARPYCRYFCPYGVLLEICSRISWKQVELTPKECINCRLCVGMCPIDAIDAPRTALSDRVRGRQFRQFLSLLVFLPLIILGGAGVGYLAGAGVAQLHPGVSLVSKWQGATEADEDLFPEIEAFKHVGGTLTQAEAQALEIIDRFQKGCMISGVFIGLILGLRLLVLSKLQGSQVHQANRYRCVACGRCFAVCPNQ